MSNEESDRVSWVSARTLATFLTASLLNRGGADRPKFWGTSFCTRPNDRAPYLSAHQQVFFSVMSAHQQVFFFSSVMSAHQQLLFFSFQLCHKSTVVVFSVMSAHQQVIFSSYVSISTGVFPVMSAYQQVFFSYVSISKGVFSVMSAHQQVFYFHAHCRWCTKVYRSIKDAYHRWCTRVYL